MRIPLSQLALTMVLSSSVASAETRLSTYDQEVLADRPILYVTVSGDTAAEADLSGHGHRGTYDPAKPAHQVSLPNGDHAASFDGTTESLDIPSTPTLSIPKMGILTVEAWIRPSVLQFPRAEGDGYVHWLGKGRPGQQEYAGRMYSLRTTASPPRPSRISGYAFNLDGGLGSGSYFQDAVKKGDWIHVTIVFNTKVRSSLYPTGYVRIYKGATLRDTTALSQFDVVPGYGEAPLRIGTRDGHSFFDGAVAKVALFNYELTAARIAAHERAMRR